MVGDLLVIKSKILDIKEKIVVFKHIMYNMEEIQEACDCEITAVRFDRKTRKSCPIPDTIKNKWLELIR